jgi:glutamyl-tRNA reductase
MIGAGQTNWLVSKFLRKQGFKHVTVANRSLGKAERLAKTFDGYAISLDHLSDFDEGFDLLIVCTGSTRPIVDPGLFEQLLQGDSAEDKVVVDLSIPHNVDAAVVEAFSPVYIQIDDLRKLAQDNLSFRAGEVEAARRLIGKQLAVFRARVQQRRVEVAMSAVPEKVRAVRQKAVNEVFSRELAELDAPTQQLIDRMMHYMEKKCIGIPMKAAREAVEPLDPLDFNADEEDVAPHDEDQEMASVGR